MYTEIKPCPALRPYIHCYWAINEQPGVTLTDRSFPDGCPEIMFNLETQVRRFTADGQVFTNPTVELVGQMTRSYGVQTQGQNRVIGVRFYPHTLACFTPEQVSQFVDHTSSVRDLLGSQILALTEQLAEAQASEEWSSRLNHFFTHRLLTPQKRSPFWLTAYAVAQLFSQKETANLDAIVGGAGVSHRYLQQGFQQYVGVSPKMLLKIIRFQKSFQYLTAGTHSLTAVAYECGYYDQAHFIRDFKALTGITPARFSLTQHPFNQHFLNAANSSYLYNF